MAPSPYVGGKENFLKIYRIATPEKYMFLYCDLQSNPPLAYSCFTKLVAKGMQVIGEEGAGNQNNELAGLQVIIILINY